MPPTEVASLEFNRFTLSLKDEELCYLNERIEIDQKDLKILSYLVRNPKRNVSVTEISKEIWGETVNVDEKLVSHHIAKVRKVLDCDPRHPTFIQTVPRKGYRFIADVKAITNQNAHPVNSKPKGDEFLINSHIFVPMYLGLRTFESASGEIRESGWTTYKEVRTEDGRLCLFENGFGVWELTKTMRFASLSVVARWRQQTYKEILDGRHRISKLANKLSAPPDTGTSFSSMLKLPGYALCTLVLDEPRWSNPMRVRHALQILASLTPLESAGKLRKDEELGLERRIIDDGIDGNEMHEFGMRGADIGYACWDGVSYFRFDEHSPGVTADLFEFEIAVQSTWWFAKCLSDEIAAAAKSARSNLEPLVEKLRDAFAQLEKIGPLETPSQRTMCEAILATSRVERLVNETVKQFERL